MAKEVRAGRRVTESSGRGSTSRRIPACEADEPASDRVALPPPGPAGAADQHWRDGRLHEDPGIHGVRVSKLAG